jgi:Holliday junction resolvase RusA-like endonuclease
MAEGTTNTGADMSNKYDYHLVVLGDPKEQKRHRTASFDRTGKPLPCTIRYDPSKTDKKNLREIVQNKAPLTPLNCPLRVNLEFCMPRPKSHYGSGKNAGTVKDSSPRHHTTKPDIDNLRKLVMDAMNGIFWRDDALICEGTTIKRYSERPRTEIFIKVLKNNEV